MTEEERKEIEALVDRAVELKLKKLNKPAPAKVWITQNAATIIVGSRRKLEKAMSLGLVRFEKKDLNKKMSPVMCYRADVEKIINKPFIQ